MSKVKRVLYKASKDDKEKLRLIRFRIESAVSMHRLGDMTDQEYQQVLDSADIDLRELEAKYEIQQG